MSPVRGFNAPYRHGWLVVGAIAAGVVICAVYFVAMPTVPLSTGRQPIGANDLHVFPVLPFVVMVAIGLLIIALIVFVLHRRFKLRTVRLVRSLRRANAELLHLHLHDPLTGLANRALLQDRAGQSLARWRREGTRLAVICVNLDGFRALNANLGHETGDECLKRVANAMSGTVRHVDTVARLGGDEFILVINELNTPDAVAVVCTKLLQAVASTGAGGVPLTASIGSAVCPDDGEEIFELIAAADAAMGATKAAGKNGYSRYSVGMSGPTSDEFLIQQELRAAIEAGELTCYYQPKYTVKDRQLIGAEALVRWPHPTKGLIPPDRFITIAEKCGLIIGLERYVLESVCAQIRAWLDSGLDVPPISVNLSAVRIRDEALPDQVQDCLDRHGLGPQRLLFEITESLAMADVYQAISTLNRFGAMGVKVALDDFGTGHSSLSYLRQLPIQQLKIDRSFIADLTHDNEDQTEIVRSIINLAHALRLSVVAEGVETEAQLAYLEQCQCDEVQGYLLSRPVPADALPRLISTPPVAGAGVRSHE